MTTKRKKPVTPAPQLPDIAQVQCDALIKQGSSYLLLARIRGEDTAVESVGSVTAGLMPEAKMQVRKGQADRLGSVVLPPKGTAPHVLLIAAVLDSVPADSGPVPVLLNLSNGKRGVGKASVQSLEGAQSAALGKVVRAYAPLLQTMAVAEGRAGGAVSQTLMQFGVGVSVAEPMSPPAPPVLKPAVAKSVTSAERSPARKPSPRPACEGKFDAIENGQARGWAWNAAKPAERLEIQIWSDTRLAGWGLADVFRDDLLEARKGDGNVAFVVDISRALRDGKPHLLQARLSDGVTPVGRMSHPFEAASAAASQTWQVLDYDSAQQWVDRMFAADAQGDDRQALSVLLAKVSVDLENSNPQRAEDTLKSAPSGLARHALVLFRLAEVVLAKRDTAKAAKAFELLSRSMPDSPWPWVGLALAASQNDSRGDVEKACSQALRRCADWPGLDRRINRMRIKNAGAAGVDGLSAAQVSALVSSCAQAILDAPDDRELTQQYQTLKRAQLPTAAQTSPLDRHHCDASRELMHWRTVLELATANAVGGVAGGGARGVNQQGNGQ